MAMMPGLIVDNFAGGGGASTGIERAFGRKIDVAINHDPEAVAMHAANHPETEHVCQNVWQADPVAVAAGRKVALAWFSPDCKHFSRAKGKPLERKREVRDLAWVVVLWAQRVAPTVIMLENVEEFLTWAPLGPDGMPMKLAVQTSMLPVTDDSSRRQRVRKTRPNGETFELWQQALKKAGYRMEWKLLRGCDYGAPTIRKRLFIVARRDGQPIVWPAATHGPGLIPYRTAANDVIDWSIPCPSIFERERPLAEATCRRIAAGIMKFVVNNPRPFIVPTTHGTWGADRAHDGNEPLRTVGASSGGDFAVVMPALLPVTHQGDDERVYDPAEPLNSVTSAHRGEIALASATLIHRGNGEREGQAPRAMDPQKPLGTPVAGGIKHGLAVAHLEKFSENSRGRPADEQLDTVMAGAPRHGVVEATLAPFVSSYYGEGKGGTTRGHAANEPTRVVPTENRHALVTAFLAQHNGGEQPRAGRAADEPVSTLVHRGTQQGVVVAHIEQANGGPRNDNLSGRAADAPLSTATASGSQQRIVTSHLMSLRGTSGAGRPVDEPTWTATAQGTHIAEVRAFLIKYFASAKHGQSIDEPLHTATSKPRFGLVTVSIGGEEYVIVDIGMRMLTPRELARAQGFPDSYRLDPIVNGKPLTKTAQVRMIGNSVNPDVADALVRANCRVAANDEDQAVAA